MKTNAPNIDPSGVPVPDSPLRAELAAQLTGNETVVASVHLDLDGRLHFGEGVLAVTGSRLLARLPGETQWHAWPIEHGLSLRHFDHAGVGTIELHGVQGRLARWRYTLGHNPAALKLVSEFERARTTLVTGQVPDDADDGHGDPHIEAAAAGAPSKRWALLRLWRFARPYQWPLLGGFLLTLAATGATLVPPYLTMPLMDEILIPYQNGKPIDNDKVTLYLGGLLAAALFAWALGWARTFILAKISERIGADLRITTYEHLQKLSLEFFGGKRTGDLITRVGSETDRICVFLSLHLLDFATDVLMIVMTAAILVSINPWLALVTLLPLPFIGWMIHVVRDKLRHGFEKVDRIWAEITNVLADTIPGIRVVKAFAQEKREVARFRVANQHNLAVNDRVNKVWSLFSPTVTLLTEMGLLVVWGFGIWQVAGDQMTVGVLAAFLE